MERGKGQEKESHSSCWLLPQTGESLPVNPELKAEMGHDVPWGLANPNKDGNVTEPQPQHLLTEAEMASPRGGPFLEGKSKNTRSIGLKRKMYAFHSHESVCSPELSRSFSYITEPHRVTKMIPNMKAWRCFCSYLISKAKKIAVLWSLWFVLFI